MGCVGCLGRQTNFSVRRHLNLTRARSMICDTHAPHFRVIFGGYHHFEHRCQRAIPARDFGTVLEKTGVVSVRFHAARLIPCRPDFIGLLVAQIDVGTPAIPRRVLSPARYGDIAPTAIARSSGGQHHSVSPVREQLCSRCGFVRRREASQRRRHKIADVRGCRHFFRARTRHQYVARCTFLQK